MVSLAHYSQPYRDKALPAGHPFSGVNYGGYWSSTTSRNFPYKAWFVDLGAGFNFDYYKYFAYHGVWPVRGGQ